VFVPNLFGDRNMLSIFMSQIAITISVSLLASWLVAVSLIPMLSARMKTPPAVKKDTGMIPSLQRRYASFLRWTLEHRGKSILGIVLIVLLSFIPATQMKTNMFGGEEVGEADIFYQWNGAYTKQQISEEVQNVEDFLDRRRKEFGIVQIYSFYSEEGWAGTQVKFDTDSAAETQQPSRRGPSSASAIRAAPAAVAVGSARTCSSSWSAIPPKPSRKSPKA
jgi:HAE1 family hydrophobic/amphiphilic exporter-1